MIVSELWVYPIKSFPGIRVESSTLEARGLRDDRRMMVVDENFKFITQRECPAMALLSITETPDGWNLISPTAGSVDLGRDEDTGVSVEVTVWDSVVRANLVSDAADLWLTQAFGRGVRLVRMTESSDRPCQDGQVSFADGYPVMILGRASLDDLNKRLIQKVEMNRFRPNFVISGSTPYEEDTWGEIEIGGARLRATSRCARCMMTTIDPITAKSGAEPLRTLAGYRLHGKAVDFGMNYIPVVEGAVRVGDSIVPVRT